MNNANQGLERNSHEVAKHQYSGVSHEVVEQNYT